jgi:hypothetical protein
MRISDQQIAQAARSAGFIGNALVISVAVALAESSGDVGSIGDGGMSFGLWQVHTPAHPQYSSTQLRSDANYAARAAFQISGGGGNWQPWTTFRTGAYRRFMNRAAAASASVGNGSYAGNAGYENFFGIPVDYGSSPSDTSLSFIADPFGGAVGGAPRASSFDNTTPLGNATRMSAPIVAAVAVTGVLALFVLFGD